MEDPQLIFTGEYRIHFHELMVQDGVFSDAWWKSLREVVMAYIKMSEITIKEDFKIGLG